MIASDPLRPPLLGRRIAVTGCRRGLGQALARAFVAAGAEVLVHAREAAQAEEVRSQLGAARAVAGELLDPSLAARLAEAGEAMGGLDALILSAGVLGPMGPLATIDFATFREVMETNVTAQLRLFVAALPQLLATRGTVVWMSSGVGRFGLPGYGAYCVSKHAIEGLSRLAHAEHGAAGLVSVAVAPGMVQTDMLRAATGEDDVSRFTQPEVAAQHFVRLLSAAFARGGTLAGRSLDAADF